MVCGNTGIGRLGLSIRPAVAEDIDGIHALVRDAYGRYVPRIGVEPAPMNADYAVLVERGHVWVGVEEHIVGLVVLVPEDGHLLLENVAVAPFAHGRGFGGALLDFADMHARALQYDEVRLYTNEQMTENLTYYPRRGYVETHRATVDGYRRVYFSKQL